MSTIDVKQAPRTRSKCIPFAQLTAMIILACTHIGCNTPSPQPVGGQGGESGSTGGGGQGGGGDGGGGGGATSCVDPTRVDLLFVIDNSRDMADKQQILALHIPDLVKRLVNPYCVDANGVLAQMQPNDPITACVAGSTREFEPIVDIHIGVISSSIGGHGADVCPNIDTTSKECEPVPNTTNNDKGHLIARLDQCGGQEAPTFMNKKFLAWDPTNKYGGETVIDNGTMGIVPTLRDMVIGTGQTGCQYQSQLESVYRFLADPDPYESIIVDNYKAVPMGTDNVLLQQRAEFLRPDSLLAVMIVTGENDCSTKEYGPYYYVGQQYNGATPVRMPRPTSACATNPNDPGCKSCGETLGGGECQDPNGGSGPALLTEQEDNPNLRCWDQKRRFGIDFLYPIDRYVQAFSKVKIADRSGNLVDNPIFSDLNPSDANTVIRGPEQVLIAGIVGVPWQDIARDTKDLKKGYKNASELAAPMDAKGFNAWDVILGNYAAYEKPLDPLMIETYEKRTGTNPITGDVLVDASMPGANPINGHERTINYDDLQYACIVPLLPGTQRDCTNTNLTACDCTDPTNDNPLCEQDPNNANKPTIQTRFKAYPGLRHLAVLEGLGDQAIVGSICPAQMTNNNDLAKDFGFRPTMEAVIEWIKRRKCTPAP